MSDVVRIRTGPDPDPATTPPFASPRPFVAAGAASPSGTEPVPDVDQHRHPDPDPDPDPDPHPHPDPERAARGPLYPRLLRLRHVHPNAWQRAVLGEGMAAFGGLLALADLASAWSIVVLPVAVAVVVKAHDVLAGVLSESRTDPS